MRFKTWFENLSGPGGGGTLEPSVGVVEKLARSNAKKGVGALPTFNKDEDPPINVPPSPDADYYPLTRKMSKKRMKKR